MNLNTAVFARKDSSVGMKEPFLLIYSRKRMCPPANNATRVGEYAAVKKNKHFYETLAVVGVGSEVCTVLQ